MKLKANLSVCFWLLACSFVNGQIEEFNYLRPLEGPTDQWHKLVIPDEVFGKVAPDLHDLRIFGITQRNDTVEAPYFLQLAKGEVTSKVVSFKMLNTSFNENGYYFTFEIPTKEPISQIQLDFQQQNFDWLLRLEGSQDLQEWFTVVENYRILSIKNELTDYQFTKVSFPDTRYRYLRLRVDSKEKPNMTATITQHQVTAPELVDYRVQQMVVREIKESKQTEVDLELALPVPVSALKLDINDTFDYYRPITFEYLADSFKTEQGWKYNYRVLTSGTLSSLESNDFTFFNSAIAKRIKITIDNHDNRPLNIGDLKVKGYVHSLVTRFSEPAEYYLVYGQESARSPNYDISRFTDKIPEAMTNLQLGEEQMIKKEASPDRSPLFVNRWWLWAIMALIILMLGWFTLKMMRKA